MIAVVCVPVADCAPRRDIEVATIATTINNRSPTIIGTDIVSPLGYQWSAVQRSVRNRSAIDSPGPRLTGTPTSNAPRWLSSDLASMRESGTSHGPETSLERMYATVESVI